MSVGSKLQARKAAAVGFYGSPRLAVMAVAGLWVAVAALLVLFLAGSFGLQLGSGQVALCQVLAISGATFSASVIGGRVSRRLADAEEKRFLARVEAIGQDVLKAPVPQAVIALQGRMKAVEDVLDLRAPGPEVRQARALGRLAYVGLILLLIGDLVGVVGSGVVLGLVAVINAVTPEARLASIGPLLLMYLLGLLVTVPGLVCLAVAAVRSLLHRSEEKPR